MKKLLQLKTMLLLCALMTGSGSAWGTTTQVTSATATNGNSYVLAVYYNGDYYAIPGASTITSSNTYSGVKLTLNAIGKVNTTDASNITWTLEAGSTSGQFAIKSGDKYLSKSGTTGTSNKKISTGTSAEYWAFTQQSDTYTTYVVESKKSGATVNLYLTNSSSTIGCYASTSSTITLLEIGDVPTSSLDHITLSGTYKTSFYSDEDFSYEGLIVTATFEDNTSFVVTPTSVSTPDFSTTGTKTVTVSYTRDEVTKTATYDITVTERPKFTVFFSDGGSLTEASANAGITLPDREDTGDYSFVGWAEAAVAAGSSTATTIEAGETYYPTANCTLYPVYSYSVYGTVEEWTEITAVPEDGEYAICAATYALKAEISDKTRYNNGTIEIIDGTPAKLSSAPNADCVWEISKPDTYYRIKNGTNYAGGTTSKNQGALLTDATDDHAKWSITYDTDKFVIVNYGRTQDSGNPENAYLRNNNTSGWACYSSSQSNAPRLFKKGYTNKTATFYTSNPIGLATISINALCTDGEGNYYGTYSNSSAFEVPAGLTVSEISVTSGKLTISNYAEGAVVPANTGVMVFAKAAGNKTVVLSDEAGTSVLGEDNMMKASSVAMTQSDTKFYRLTMHNGTDIGFWWGAADGASFDIAANKAYLAVPTSALATARQGFSLFGEDEVNGIDNPQLSTLNSQPIYSLSGQRVEKAKKGGLYIVNGKKCVIR